MAQWKRERKSPLLLLGEPGLPAEQIQISKRSVLWLPGTVIVLAAVWFAGVEWQTEQSMLELESRWSAESARLTVAVADKNQEIRSLERELLDMAGQAGHLKNRFEELHALESKILRSVQESNVRITDQNQAEMSALPSEWPTVSHKITSRFGYRKDPITGRSTFHAGLDISGNAGQPVFAAGDGVVKNTGYERARGNYIIITHRDELESMYFHLRKVGVSEGDHVERGRPIGQLGNSGRSTGPHLHFQILVHNEPVNPLSYLSSVKQD